jgi:tetrahydromethanopterin S-methyltransferase subunit G
MNESTENLVLEHLRHLRAGMDRLHERLDDLTTRVGRIEVTMAQGFARTEVALAEHSVRFDKVERRLDRIETRLGLIDA